MTVIQKRRNIMKKQTIIILFLSAILCLTMLFVSCDQGKTVETTEETTTSVETTEEITTEAVIEDVEVDYSSIIADWNKYVEFDTPELPSVLDKYNNSLITTDDALDNVDVRLNGKLLFVTTTYNNTEFVWGEGEYPTRQYTYAIYNVETGKAIRPTYTVPSYRVYDEYPELTYSFNVFGGILEVTTGQLTKTILNPDNDPNTPDEYAYDYIYTYSYYDQNGDTLASGLEERDCRTDFTANGDLLVYVADKCYLMRDDKVFFTFNKGQERPLPRVDFEYLDYKYLFEGSTVRVFDANFNLIAQYTDHYNYDGFYQQILNNGNVYTQYLYGLDKNATDYDYATVDGNKYNVKHVILDVASGKAAELELGFVVANLISNVDNDANMTVKDNNHFAEVYKFTEGKIATECSFLILDNNMTEVKELPKILKNQCEGTKFSTSGKLIIAMDTVRFEGESENVYYTVDVTDNTVELFVDIDETNYDYVIGGYVPEYSEFGNYFIYNGIVYTTENELVCDLTDAESFAVLGDTVLTQYKNTDELDRDTYTYYLVTFEGSSFSTHILASRSDDDNYSLEIEYDSNISCYVVKQIDWYGDVIKASFYNCYGEEIGTGYETTQILGSSNDGITIRFRNYFGSAYRDYYYFFKY